MPTRNSRRRVLDSFLEQENTPVFTSIAAVTGVIGWGIIAMDLLTTPRDWGGLAQGFLLVFILTAGSLFNVIVGAIAVSRGEYCGGRVAALGIGLWFLTAAVFYLVRGGRFW
ncbi:MAG TPA: hypothetical protein VNY05_15885 [Candidatus Acidoferrales bacterium]|jgi:hypothetical protein|nr:hypothetical protein [Candidatus Acidoferrales bacterium]